MVKRKSRKCASYRLIRHKCLSALVLLCWCAFCRADTNVLKEGQTLTGDILLEKEKQLIMDIGVTVVTVPKDKILKYEYAEAPGAEADGAEAEAAESELPADKLYRVANLKKTTIEKCVDATWEVVAGQP